MTLPAGVQHRNPDAMGRHGSMVPTYTATPKGDLHEGFIDLPKRLVKPFPLTNAWHEQQRTLEAAMSRWVEWKAKKGWRPVSKPKWQGPMDIPTATASDEMDGDRKRYWVSAMFVRTSPFWINTDAALWFRDQADLYAVDLMGNQTPWTPETVGKKVINDPNPVFIDGLKVAEERRHELGLERKDFLFGPLDKAVGENEI